LTTDLAVTSPQINVSINRDQAAAMGVTANAIEGAFYDAYGPRWVSTIYAAVNEYKVLLELLPQFQADPSALSFLYFKGSPAARGGGSAGLGSGVGAGAGGLNAPAAGVSLTQGTGGPNGVVVP